MANYFDIGNGGHRRLVDDEVLGRDDFQALASIAEFDIISHFTRRKRDRAGKHYPSIIDVETGDENLRIGIGPDIYDTDTTAVYLEYYKPDADNVENSTDGNNFKAAMRHAIARQIEHLASQREADPGIESESRGRRSVTYREVVDKQLPRNVIAPLLPYDVRPIPHVL